EPKDGITARTLLEIDHDTALAAVEGEKHAPHAGMTRRLDLPHDVALRRLDLDDVGAHVGELKRGIRPHQDRRQIEDAHALQWTHGPPLFLSPRRRTVASTWHAPSRIPFIIVNSVKLSLQVRPRCATCGGNGLLRPRGIVRKPECRIGM